MSFCQVALNIDTYLFTPLDSPFFAQFKTRCASRGRCASLVQSLSDVSPGWLSDISACTVEMEMMEKATEILASRKGLSQMACSAILEG
jgi:hypothetical protein